MVRNISRCIAGRRAFTLVELLVVIGIIAALIGILLPVLSGVQARGRDIKCQSNLRQIVQALVGYTAENKGSMPWGFVWNRSNDKVHPDPYNVSNNWDEASDNVNGEYISWAGLVGKYMTRKGAGIDDNTTLGAGLRVTFPPVLQCPEATMYADHVVGYVINFIVGISPVYEILGVGGGRPPRAQIKPPPITLMLKDTALVWDTAIRPNWQENSGFLVGADIDEERFWSGALTPQWRYYSIKDPYANPGLAGGTFGNNKPVKLAIPGYPYLNKDPRALEDERWPYQGNLRFRHGKNTTCNAGFADGSVRQFTAKVSPDLSVSKHDALRRNFMIKWPPGVPPDTSKPF